jgi:hypothetical protein
MINSLVRQYEKKTNDSCAISSTTQQENLWVREGLAEHIIMLSVKWNSIGSSEYRFFFLGKNI